MLTKDEQGLKTENEKAPALTDAFSGGYK